MRSTRVRVLVSMARISPYRVTLGQCFANTFVQYSSFSTCHSQCMPARSKPKSIPPIPEKRDPKVMLLISLLQPPDPLAQSLRIGHFTLSRLPHIATNI